MLIVLGAFSLSFGVPALGSLNFDFNLGFDLNSSNAAGLGGRVVQDEYLVVDNHTIRAYQQPVVGKGGSTGEPIEYTIKKGDTLSGIADDYNISINTVLWENDITRNSTLRPGDKLTILPETGVRHKVKSGESISGIAYNYGVDSETIIEANELGNEAFIRAGEWLVIPGGEPPSRNTTTRYAQEDTHSTSQQIAESSYLLIPASGKNWGRAHFVNASDIANSWGTPVYAAAAGKITRAYSSGWHGGYGHYIKIRHPDGTETLYAHLNKLVRTSGYVEQGEQIATMGSTGNSTGPHLHFEVRNAYNPLIGPTRRVEALNRP